MLVEGAGRTDAAGLAWAAIALVCEAAFTLLAVPVLPRHGAWGVSVHSVWIGAVMLALLSAMAEGPAAITRLTMADWAAIGYLAVMVTAVAFILWYSTVAALGPGPVGLLTGIAPVSAALTGIMMGSQAPRPLMWLGMLVVIGGLVTGLRATRTRQETHVRLRRRGRRTVPGDPRWRDPRDRPDQRPELTSAAG